MWHSRKILNDCQAVLAWRKTWLKCRAVSSNSNNASTRLQVGVEWESALLHTGAQNVRYSRRVLDTSIWYSLSTRVANYSDSTALVKWHRERFRSQVPIPDRILHIRFIIVSGVPRLFCFWLSVRSRKIFRNGRGRHVTKQTEICVAV